jgi:hypothetical protein
MRVPAPSLLNSAVRAVGSCELASRSRTAVETAMSSRLAVLGEATRAGSLQ